jgi:HSP20 family molecular chaperone IbpA
MWSEACRVLERAERLQRQFFNIDFPRGARVAWEPPVDVFEDDRELIIVVALPGVSPGNADSMVDEGTLLVRAKSPLWVGSRHCSIQRLEIPHGYFERRILLPQIRLELDSQQWIDGCLVLTMRKL